MACRRRYRVRSCFAREAPLWGAVSASGSARAASASSAAASRSRPGMACASRSFFRSVVLLPQQRVSRALHAGLGLAHHRRPGVQHDPHAAPCARAVGEADGGQPLLRHQPQLLQERARGRGGGRQHDDRADRRVRDHGRDGRLGAVQGRAGAPAVRRQLDCHAALQLGPQRRRAVAGLHVGEPQRQRDRAAAARCVAAARVPGAGRAVRFGNGGGSRRPAGAPRGLRSSRVRRRGGRWHTKACLRTVALKAVKKPRT